MRLQFNPSSFPYVKRNYLCKGLIMKYASAFYVAEPSPEIYIFIDEEPSGLPETAAEIGKSTDVEEFLSMVEPYFILAKDK